jgi:retinol dehydrogenase 12
MRPVPIAVAVTAAGAAVGAAVTRAGQPRPATYDLRGQVTMVTGANSGIGLETAVALARGGAHVLVTARDEARGADAVEQIRARTDTGSVELVPLDLSSLASVRACADDVASRTDRLHVLVNNAGAVFGAREETEDGFEATIGVNHLGPFLLTHLLVPRLAAAGSARVVTVASSAHRHAELDLDDLMWRSRPYRSMVAYGTSKLANVLFARELARHVAHHGITSTSIHPGTVRSGFGRDGEGHWLLGIGVRVAAPLFVDAERGASTSVFAAGDPSMADVTGEYLSRRRVTRPSSMAQDDLMARRLWEHSAELVGIERSEISRAD